MCGIYGSLGPVDWDINIAKNSMRRRGPDDSGVWVDHNEQLLMGHVRLSIIDTSNAGHQPMFSQDNRVVMVYNGEIYNYKKLRLELEELGHNFKSNTDTEVLLELFAKYGKECFNKINGIFAAAFWERDVQTLTLLRDPLGVKPLYWANTNQGFVFASEMKALLRSGAVKPKLSPSAVLNHLSYLWSPGPSTIASGIYKINPGSFMQLAKNVSPESEFYTDIKYTTENTNIDHEQVIRNVGRAVRNAVYSQMVSDVPLGAFLSGGLDSSAVVAFAQNYLNEEVADKKSKLQCFTIDLKNGSAVNEGFVEDLPYAKKVANFVGVDLHVVEVNHGLMDRLSEMIYFLDEPTPDPAALNTLIISELARANGIKVLLSGTGGDDIFTGYRRHFALTQEHWWENWPVNVRQAMSQITNRLPSRIPLTRRISKAFQYAGMDSSHRLAGYFQWIMPSKALSLLNQEFRVGLNHETIFGPLLDTLSRLPDETAPLNRLLYLECKHFLADHNLNYADKMGMAAGIEIRVPLIDLDLVKLASGLPVDIKQRRNVGKWAFKKAMEPYLPHEVIYRPKTGFGIPLREWIHGVLRPLIEDVLSEDSLLSRGVFDVYAVRRLLQDDREGHVDASYTILSMVCIELWCRQYIDGKYSIDINL
jgi:asparagine synthase (glutamine-hydrolysing)